jgi:hypothetical protein
MTTATAQAEAVGVAARFFSGRQSGPKPGSKEARFVAPILEDAERTLRLVAQHREAFAAIVKRASAE